MKKIAGQSKRKKARKNIYPSAPLCCAEQRTQILNIHVQQKIDKQPRALCEYIFYSTVTLFGVESMKDLTFSYQLTDMEIGLENP